MTLKLLNALAVSLALAVPALPSLAEGLNPLRESDYKSYHSLGCLLLKECTEGVQQITSVQDLEDFYGVDYSEIATEGNKIFAELDRLGIEVWLSDSKYFPVNHRGAYYTVGNNFFLNKDFMDAPHHFISVMRHEGWHAAQDCMAGSLDNTMIAVIHNEDDIPFYWRDVAARTYDHTSLPWEQEAMWAGHTENMTVEALAACQGPVPMWETFAPTPLTRQYLIDKGFINE